MLSDHDFLNAAVLNNAEWCNTICNTKDAAGVFDADIWYADGLPPQYYPNLITLRPDISAERIRQLTKKFDDHFSIKDSFNDLDLATLGMTRLFEAEWLLAPDVQTFATRYQIITDEDELHQWQSSWDKEIAPGFFDTSLLKNQRVKFIGIKNENTFVAGAISNLSNGVVGISNMFYGDGLDSYYNSFLSAAQEAFPGVPVVGYSRGEELEFLKQKGWRSLGPLSVWIK